jgi:hypothetical protein
MEPSYQIASDTRKSAVTNGIIWAIINIALFLVVFYVKPDLMGSFAWQAVQLLIGLGLAVYFCLDLRKKAGGYWTFKEALSNIFIMFLVPALIVFFFTIIFAKYLEPDYAVRMQQIMENSTIKMYESMGMDQEKIDEAMEKNEVMFEKQLNPGFGDLLLGIGTIVIMYFIGALIFAAIFKKDPPLFTKVVEE